MAFYRCGADTSSSTSEPKSVVFYDYDGTRLYQYTKTEFLALTVMPDSPNHTRLNPRGWNWSLANAQAYVTEHTYLDIGRVYETVSGKTEIDITITDGTLSPYLAVTRNSGTVTVDWGDGTTPDEITSDTALDVPHTYATAGDYTIKIGGDITLSTGTGNFGYLLHGALNANNKTYPYHEAYMDCVKGLYLSATTTLSNYSLNYYRQLEVVTLSTAVTQLLTSTFQYCGSLKHITIPKTVTTIGATAFCFDSSLESVCLPDSLTRIDGSAFRECKVLKQVTIPTSVTVIGTYCFKNCYSLRRIILNENLTAIPDGLVQYCFSLNEIDISDSIGTVGANAFAGTALKTIYIPTANFSSGATLGANAFNGCYMLNTVQIEDTAKAFTVGENAFYNCPNLKTINLPDSITSMGNMIFNGVDGMATSLTYLKLPSKAFPNESTANNCVNMVEALPLLETIEFTSGATVVGSVRSCMKLTNVIIPEGVTTIAKQAFYYLESLTDIKLPSTLTKIGDTCFQYCVSLSDVELPAGLTYIGTNAFMNCYNLESITMPTALTNLGTNFAQNCVKLKQITLPSLTNTGNYCLASCTSLTSVTLPNNVTTIGNYFCQSCTSLEHLVIPASVTSIGQYALTACSGLQYVQFEGSTPPTTIGTRFMNSVPTTCEIRVPRGSLSAYESKANMPSSSTYNYVEYDPD